MAHPKVQPYYPNGPTWYGYYGVPWIGGSVPHIISAPYQILQERFRPTKLHRHLQAPPMDISSSKGGLVEAALVVDSVVEVLEGEVVGVVGNSALVNSDSKIHYIRDSNLMYET